MQGDSRPYYCAKAGKNGGKQPPLLQAMSSRHCSDAHAASIYVVTTQLDVYVIVSCSKLMMLQSQSQKTFNLTCVAVQLHLCLAACGAWQTCRTVA